MRASSICLLSFALFSLAIAACEGDDSSGPADGDVVVTACEEHADCGEGRRCQGGSCITGTVAEGDGGVSDDDAGPTMGALAVLPGTTVEFGAQLLGYPVHVDVTLSNVGNGPLTVMAVLLDDDTGEFSATPSGSMSVRLQPGDNMQVRVTHTPTDGVPDTAEVKVLHDGEGNITTLYLFAEFKGDAELVLTEDLAVLTPSLAEVDFGEVTLGNTATRTVWLRNTGNADSILTINDLTLTPATVGFAFVDEPDLPIVLGAWSTGLCPGGDVASCPPGASACEDTVCLDEEGAPLNAVPLALSFSANTLPSQATLTLKHDAGGTPVQTNVTLRGMPTQPDIQVTPAEASFGPVLVGAPVPAAIVLTVENVGAGPLLITKVVEPTSTSVYSFAYSRPVPRIDGDPALRIDSGATPLEITVTFTPEAGEGYAGVLTLHTNDNDELQVPLTLQGTGVVCQANAHVNDAGVCECDASYIACGAECKLPGATACGDACVDCTAVGGLGSGTLASCGLSGQCEYSCATAYYDIDDATDGAPGDGNWNGCEYLCPRNPPQGETCNRVDDDCDGQVDEGLPLDASDVPTRNDTRQTAKAVAPIDAVPATPGAGATATLSQRTLYPAGDNDWFKVKAVEGDGSLSCANEIPCLDGGQENYRTIFEVVSPSGLDYDLEVWAPRYPNYEDPNGDGQLFTDANLDNKIDLQWSRASSLGTCIGCNLFGIGCFAGGYGCAFNDSQVFYVRVKPQAGQATTFSCEPYELKVTSISLPPGSGN